MFFSSILLFASMTQQAGPVSVVNFENELQASQMQLSLSSAAAPKEFCEIVEAKIALPSQTEEGGKEWRAALLSMQRELLLRGYELAELEQEGTLRDLIGDRLLTIDIFYSAGCVSPDWDIMQSASSVEEKSSAPPFIFDAGDSREHWAAKVRSMLAQGQLEQARALLNDLSSKSPAARNLLGVLDILDLGQGANKSRGYARIRLAARAGYAPAVANLGLCHIFGAGTNLDPTYGVKLLDQAQRAGIALRDATWLLKINERMLRIEDFSEVTKTLRLSAAGGSVSARGILGILASRGLTSPACGSGCGEVAEGHARSILDRGGTRFADVIRANLRATEGRAAVLSELIKWPSLTGALARNPSLRTAVLSAHTSRAPRARSNRTVRGR